MRLCERGERKREGDIPFSEKEIGFERARQNTQGENVFMHVCISVAYDLNDPFAGRCA